MLLMGFRILFSAPPAALLQLVDRLLLHVRRHACEVVCQHEVVVVACLRCQVRRSRHVRAEVHELAVAVVALLRERLRENSALNELRQVVGEILPVFD